MPNTPNEIYEQLETKVLPLLKDYQTDLTHHDRVAVTDEMPGIPFLHFTRDLGTTMVPMYPADADKWPAKGQYANYLFAKATREQILDETTKMADYCVTPGRNYHLALHYDGQELKEVTFEQALAIAHQHQANLLKEWKAQ